MIIMENNYIPEWLQQRNINKKYFKIIRRLYKAPIENACALVHLLNARCIDSFQRGQAIDVCLWGTPEASE